MRRRHTDTSGSYLLRWPRWEAYQHAVDGWIYPASIGPERYDPTHEPALPTELARIVLTYGRARTTEKVTKETIPIDGDGGDCDTIRVYTDTYDATKKAIVSFFQRFGFLGQAEIQEPTGLRKVEIEGHSYLVPGDSLWWFLEHSLHVRNCLTLAGALNPGENSVEPERARQALRYIEKTRQKLFPGLPLLIPTLEKTLHPVDLSTLYKPDDSESIKARAVLRAYLAPNLGGVERGYDVETGRSVFKFKALIQLIYWQLSDWIDGERLRRCGECQTYFFARDDRQRFCPPPQGIRESRCARRARMRALRYPDKK